MTSADSDYWKKIYQPLWQKTGEREKAVAHTIQNLTGHKVKTAGLGAGSTAFLPGSAASHGHQKGDADLVVERTNIRLEVTGPNILVSHADPLWLRPDKIANAKAHLGETDTWVVHCIQNSTIIRVIRLDEQFFGNYDRGQYETVHPMIRGISETYVAIPHNNVCVRPFDVLIHYITNWGSNSKR